MEPVQPTNILQICKEAWPVAQKTWSNYVRLREPEWCETQQECGAAGIKDSFAMIRLKDHRIVIDIGKIQEHKLEDCMVEILAHEIGHHIYTPANLNDNALLLSKIRWSLIGVEPQAPMVANLYEDLLINDRLQRTKGLDMAKVYKKLNTGETASKVWALYMRAYEYLWKLKRYELAPQGKLHTPSLDADASIIASLIRSYSKNWVEGATRFGAMFYPYLMEEKEAAEAQKSTGIILDADEAGMGGGVVAGMAELDAEVLEGISDPRAEALGGKDKKQKTAALDGQKLKGGVGPEQRYLNPGVYMDLFRQVNPDVDAQSVINNYYKEIALPYLIDFPTEKRVNPSFTLPEGTDVWDIGDSSDEIDWIETSIYSPIIFPGVNTLKRVYGSNEDEEDENRALDVYIGIDCSGSMGNPTVNFSWPVLAATIIGLSALRAGAKVMACLSGEPGSFLQNDGFVSGEKDILTVLTSYLGTGYAYGIGRLKEPFAEPRKNKSHLIVVSDDDIFSMLSAETDNGDDNWEIAEKALQNGGGSGSMVLHSRPNWHKDEVKRLEAMGWQVYYVTNQEELLTFASEFAKGNYE